MKRKEYRLENKLNLESGIEIDERSRLYLTPEKIVCTSVSPEGSVEDAEALLRERPSQISLHGENLCRMDSTGGSAWILLDFGRELHGGIEFSIQKVTGSCENVKLRLCFGESVMEALSTLGGEKNATNDHSPRDFTVYARELSMNTAGQTGFRFVKIELLTPDAQIYLKTVKAVLLYRDMPYLGSFECDDELVNRIWDVGAYTVHLNMQKYIWDGIKRDRLVWIGDLHPEIMTIQNVFGDQKLIRDSLDYVVEETPRGAWMNDIPSYSMWWIIIQYDYFMQFGNREYLEKQIPYMKEICRELSKYIGEDGQDTTPEMRFVDWPTRDSREDTDTGLQALRVLATRYAMRIFELFHEEEMVRLCRKDYEKLMQWNVPIVSAKQSNALAVLAGLLDAETVNNESLKIGGAEGMSTFMGYYILQARAEAGDVEGAFQTAREYWGGMIRLGATTFWEDFDVKWMKNAAPIDRLPEADEIDVHGTYGRYCYQGFRHSLCHGWASGITSWLTKYVLGIRIMEPGCRKIEIRPNLCGLTRVKGTYPTPEGVLKVEHKLQKNGEIKTTVHAPEGVKVILP